MLKAFVATALLAASTSLLAQAPAGPGPDGKGGRFARPDCTKAADPKACEERQKARAERREKLRAAHEKARQACEGKKGDEHRACIGTQMCAQSPDPAKCEARLKDRAERHKQRRQAQPPAEKK